VQQKIASSAQGQTRGEDAVAEKMEFCGSKFALLQDEVQPIGNKDGEERLQVFPGLYQIFFNSAQKCSKFRLIF
jgi:hypothetical protein